MGVEYRHFLVPEDSSFRPAPEQIENLIKAWLENGYLDRSYPAEYAITGHNSTSFNLLKKENGILSKKIFNLLSKKQLLLKWEAYFGDTDLRNYPLSTLPEGDLQEVYFDFELHLTDDFTYPLSQLVYGLEQVVCQCGEELSYDLDTDPISPHRIKRKCKCKKEFRPQDHTGIIRSGFTGEEIELPGGGTYRFAIVVDCGKCLPFPREAEIREPFIQADKKFLTICENALDTKFFEINDIY